VLALASQAAVAVENSRLRTELQEAYRETIFRLARAAEYRDTDTGDHIRRVSQYAAEIARGAGMHEEEVEDLLLAVSMHDVGKIAVPDAVLKKPGRLEAGERLEIEKHTDFGSAILGGSGVAVLELSRQVAHTHHEKWDGSGYPCGLRGDEIPLAGRICALADVFDALTSRRCYKPPMPVEEACEIIRQGAGTHFDPRLAEIFFERLPRLLEIRAAHPA
jgi:putative two-component system response regulator